MTLTNGSTHSLHPCQIHIAQSRQHNARPLWTRRFCASTFADYGVQQTNHVMESREHNHYNRLPLRCIPTGASAEVVCCLSQTNDSASLWSASSGSAVAMNIEHWRWLIHYCTQQREYQWALSSLCCPGDDPDLLQHSRSTRHVLFQLAIETTVLSSLRCISSSYVKLSCY
jgi:hypothetical protein